MRYTRERRHGQEDRHARRSRNAGGTASAAAGVHRRASRAMRVLVTVYSGKVDLGTGVRTAMAQIAAEELSVPLSKVHVVQGDTLLTPDQGVTFGSLSIQNGGMQIRQAAATARDALVGEAARK